MITKNQFKEKYGFTLDHSFPLYATDIQELFKYNTFSKWCNQLEKQALQVTDREGYLGKGFEWFLELLFKTMPYSPHFFGIYDYQIWPSTTQDTGVDMFFKNRDGEWCVGNGKYKANNKALLTANKDHLSNMFSTADTHPILEGKIKPSHKIKMNNKFVFTTGEGAHLFTDFEMYHNKVTFIPYKTFKFVLDKNIGFWEKCREIAKDLEK